MSRTSPSIVVGFLIFLCTLVFLIVLACVERGSAGQEPRTEFGPGVEHRVVCFLGIRYLVLRDTVRPGIAITPLYNSSVSISRCDTEAERKP